MTIQFLSNLEGCPYPLNMATAFMFVLMTACNADDVDAAAHSKLNALKMSFVRSTQCCAFLVRICHLL